MRAAAIALAIGLVAYFALRPRAVVPPLTAGEVAALVSDIDYGQFGGWFGEGPRRQSLIVAIASAESDFRPAVIGDGGRAYGLMQIHASTAGDFGISDARELLDPYTNILTAMAYLHWAWQQLELRLNRQPTISEWLASYNAGLAGVIQDGIIPLGYIRRVRDHWAAVDPRAAA
jgi:soluble lytic murein transglycosylase-like protein